MSGKQAEARRLHAAGQSVREIADALDLPRTTIYLWIADASESDRVDEMMALRLQGLTNVQIAERCGVTSKHVAYALGSVPRRRSPGRAYHLKLAPKHWEAARDVAAALGLRAVQGGAAGEGSVSMLLDAIGAGELDVTWRPGYGPMQPLGVKA